MEIRRKWKTHRLLYLQVSKNQNEKEWFKLRDKAWKERKGKQDESEYMKNLLLK